MRLHVKNITLRLNEDKTIDYILSKKIGIKKENIKDYRIIKESIDARKKDDIKLNYTIEINVEKNIKHLNKDCIVIEENKQIDNLRMGNKQMESSPVIVGFGPAGMLAGIFLARKGYKPIVIERGSKIEEREKSVNEFWKFGKLNSEINVQFGEGGAGTFSDGKLTTRSKDPRINSVLKMFVEMGASEEILYKNKPHIGTDKLKNIVKNIRKEIEKLGGKVLFNTKLTNINLKNEKIVSINTNNGEIKCEILILAIGHSARDTYEMLNNKGIHMESKAFAMGFRIENLQRDIDENQYGKFMNDPRLKSAEYSLTHRSLNNRGVYSFCMCPGGYVVASSSEENSLVVNGMSYSNRNGKNANSAIVVNVTPDDFGKKPLDGVFYQRKFEKIAFEIGGKNYFSPIQNVEDFIGGNKSIKTKIEPTYSPGVTHCDLNNIYPEYINTALKDGLINFNKKIKGFSNGVLTGVETRTSSPIRLIRNENFQSEKYRGLYFSGEGAGYAGGIMSAAVDGIKVAEDILVNYKSF